MYEIRQATSADYPRIAIFIDRTYGSSARFKLGPRWEWQFLSTPYQAEANADVPIWIALNGEEVVGQIALQPGQLQFGGEILPIGWIVDVMVDVAHRGRGLAHRLNQAILASGRTAVTLTMAAATRALMERAGCITLPPVRQMVRPIGLSGQTIGTLLRRLGENRPRWRPLLAPLGRSRAGPAFIAAALKLAARANRIGRHSDDKGRLRDVAAPDPALIERLCHALTQGKAAHFDRSAAFYAWRFADAPDLDYRYAVSNDAIVVSRLPLPVELPIGTLVDILADPNDEAAIKAAVRHAVVAMAPHCEAVIAGASDPRLVRALAACGFVTVKTHHPTIISTDAALLARLAAYQGPWHFTKADHDWDQVHPAH